jgi:hypothetical protein
MRIRFTLIIALLVLSVSVQAQQAEVVITQAFMDTVATSDDLLDRTDAVLQVIEAHRGVDSSAHVDRAIMDRDSLLERLMQIVEVELPPEMRERYDRAASAIGLVGRDESYFDIYLGLLESEVAGFYDDDLDTFYIMDDTPADLQEPVMAHELFHAIQDQEWGLPSIVGRGESISDVALASQALVEGDALAVMTSYMLQDPDQVTGESLTRTAMSMSMDSATAMNTADVPPALWAQLVFPYVAGIQMIFELVEPGDWSPINAMYLDPPRSTEQVLHPERYRDRDEPTWLSIELGEIPGAERYMVDVFGEFLTGELFAQLLDGSASRASCIRAAEGWDGDRLESYRFADDPERDLIVWALVWDNIQEATAFASVATYLSVPWLDTRDRQSWTGETGNASLAGNDGGQLWVERWSDLVLIVLDRGGNASDGERRTTVDLAVNRTWDTLKRSQYPDFSLTE